MFSTGPATRASTRSIAARRHLRQRDRLTQRRRSGGIFLLDHFSFDVLGQWEVDRGPQYLSYDFWWHLGYDTMVTSEWGTPNMVENGVDPSSCSTASTATLHIWDLRRRRHLQTLDLGTEHQIALELRAAHDPTRRTDS